MEAIDPEHKLCPNCEREIAIESNFCGGCGHAQNFEEVNYASGKKKNLQLVGLFFGVELILCVSAKLIDDFNLRVALTYDVLFAVSTVCFFIGGWKDTRSLLKWPKFSALRLLALAIITLASGALVQYTVSYINVHFFDGDTTFYFTYFGHQYGLLLMIVSVALCPAIFEELAYRGFLMQKLLKIVDQKDALTITSILFFLIHFSMVSFFWMLPFAFLLGYVRLKTNTIWYGVVMHFLFNLTACAFEVYRFGIF
ncbi:MAG: CPBP family glutamic-type intramembrane protease [Pedobacter sp.]|nr:CPBP family glutamic-type intramembrane protease [Pedobacter sp.]MDQ8053827.1 CPBP family glutamic-type intramembrane protease [Pedobacter sp.]